MISFSFSTSEKCKGDPPLPLLHPGKSTWIRWETYTWAARAAWPNTAIIFLTYRSSWQLTGSEHRFLHSMHAASLERETTVTLSLVCIWAACSCTSQATKPLVYKFTVLWLRNICSGRGSRSWVIRILAGNFQAAARPSQHVLIKVSSVHSSWEQNQSVSQHCFASLLCSHSANPSVPLYWQFPWSWFSINLNIHCAKLFLLLYRLAERYYSTQYKILSHRYRWAFCGTDPVFCAAFLIL